MKKLFLLTPLLSAALVACTSHEFNETDQPNEGEIKTGFLTLNINEPGNMSTRGAFDDLE